MNHLAALSCIRLITKNLHMQLMLFKLNQTQVFWSFESLYRDGATRPPPRVSSHSLRKISVNIVELTVVSILMFFLKI